MKPDIKELIAKCRRLEADHPPNGWPAIQMSDIARLCDEIELLFYHRADYPIFNKQQTTEG